MPLNACSDMQLIGSADISAVVTECMQQRPGCPHEILNQWSRHQRLSSLQTSTMYLAQSTEALQHNDVCSIWPPQLP